MNINIFNKYIQFCKLWNFENSSAFNKMNVGCIIKFDKLNKVPS